MMVAAYNPSSNPTYYVRMNLPKKSYKVQTLVNGEFKDAKTGMICETQTLVNGVSVKNCALYVEY